MDNTMEKRGLTYSEIQEIPDKSLVLLTGLPGAGKSHLGHQIVLNGITMGKPIIFVTTDQGPSEILGILREKGLSESVGLNFIDAFTETVGLACESSPETLCANCSDLNSLSMAITELRERTGREGVLLVFDSLTSPYLFGGPEVVKFVRMFLSRLAAEGNSLFALFDEGSGQEEDLVAMMSLSNGVIKLEREGEKRILEVVKHPKLKPTSIEIPVEPKLIWLKPTWNYDPMVIKQFLSAYFSKEKARMRKEIGDFVNLFWPNLAHWSCMLWDPKRFPRMIYDLNKEEGSMGDTIQYFPLRLRFMIKFLTALRIFPKNVSRVKDMKKMVKYWFPPDIERNGIVEYREDLSKTDEHYVRIYESSDCWGFENVGSAVASHLPPYFASMCIVTEKMVRDWNAVETKCVGLGDPYCEWKVVPGEIDELGSTLEKDLSSVEVIYERLIERLMGFILEGKPLIERPKMGSEVHIHSVMHIMGFPHIAGERFRMAQRMGGAKSGKEIGERLLKAGLSEDEAQERIINFLNYCKVGKASVGETIRIKENCESLRTMVVATHIKEPSCYFTTGFLNGFFMAVKNQRVKEKRCIVAGDPYCEWEFR